MRWECHVPGILANSGKGEFKLLKTSRVHSAAGILANSGKGEFNKGNSLGHKY